jgi:hypothetical protein
MSEFKFSCPNCQQNIQATPEHSGLQINCPSCQTPLIVPQAPGEPAPHGPRLAMAPAAPHGPAAIPVRYMGPPTRKKKSMTGQIAGWSIGACVVAALLIFGPAAWKKYIKPKENAGLEQAATNAAPPPPPPELTTQEILQNANDAYKNLSDYAATAQTVAALDMSALAPGQPVMNMTSHSSLQLGRTNFYRLDWEQNALGRVTTGAAWNAGKGDFSGSGQIPAKKVKTRLEAMAPASASLVLSALIAETFFSTTNSIFDKSGEFTKTNAASPNGQPCYALLGEVNHQTLLLWINKKSFLISQVEVILGGKMDEAELKKLPSAQRNAMAMMSKLKGTITETYDNIQTNQHLLAAAFTTSYKPTINPEALRQGPPSMAGRLANPRMRRPPPQ